MQADAPVPDVPAGGGRGKAAAVRRAWRLVQHHMAAAWPLVSMVLMAAGSVLCLYLIWSWVPGIVAQLRAPSDRAAQHEKAACKHLVDTLLTTKDQVEVQRIGVILQHVRCPILARLPE